LKKLEITFEEAKKHAEASGNYSHMALALRQLSRPEFNDTSPTIAVEYAKQAQQLAQDASRKDLAWFDHGVVAALILPKLLRMKLRSGSK